MRLSLIGMLLGLMPGTALTEVNITTDRAEVVVRHGDSTVTIRRHPDAGHTIDPEYALTSRDCPPFCIQPMQIAPGVETVGELELLAWIEQASAGEAVLVIDSRTPDWVARGTIPGSVNIPWTELSSQHGADPFTIAAILERRFGASQLEGLWDFSRARTLVLFCNGPWCGQSPTNIRALLRYGYPAEKLKWYRGGMQDWHALGLTVVPPTAADGSSPQETTTPPP